MARLSRKLRVCKWVGTVGCVLIVAGFLGSHWRTICVEWTPSLYAQATIKLDNGVLYFWGRPSAVGVGPAHWGIWSYPQMNWPESGLTARPSFWQDANGYQLGLPLSLVFPVLLVPAVFLWRRDRKPLRGHCPHCDYDLTGNVSGVCPECGTACETGGESGIPARRGTPAGLHGGRQANHERHEED